MKPSLSIHEVIKSKMALKLAYCCVLEESIWLHSSFSFNGNVHSKQKLEHILTIDTDCHMGASGISKPFAVLKISE